MIRIVSLIASATEIVHALGMGHCQVGRSHECDFPTSVTSLPICTAPKFPLFENSREINKSVKETRLNTLSIYRVFEDVLKDLGPTHILTQSQCDVCAVSLSDVEQAVAKHLSFQPNILSLQADRLSGIWKDIRSVADALGIEEKGRELVDRLMESMQQISSQPLAASERPSVACLEWLEPLMAAGNWMPELVEMAGGKNLFGEAGKHSPWMSWEDLCKSDPDIVVILPCGFTLNRTAKELYWLTDRPEWKSLKAVNTHRVYITDGNQYGNRPGPRIVESLQILAEIIHPTVFDARFKGTGWKQVC